MADDSSAGAGDVAGEEGEAGEAEEPASPPNAEVTAFSAAVISDGITQNVFPEPAAICGSVCRYW